MSTINRVNDMQTYIKTGRILDAMTEFYAPDCAMQENSNAATSGLAANIQREKEFLAQVKEWKGYDVKSIAVSPDGSTASVESTIDFINQQGQPVHYEQVSIQRWKNGKITHERFYYDTGAKG
jgi:ketosteroid isomerase-like protein